MPSVTRDADTAAEAGEDDAGDVEVTASDEQVAYEILKRPPPWTCSPLQHVARIVARYRVSLTRTGPVPGGGRKPS